MKLNRSNTNCMVGWPCFIFSFDDIEKELVRGIFEVHLKHLIACRRALREKFKKEFEAEESRALYADGMENYKFRYTLWEKKRDDKRLERFQRDLESDVLNEGFEMLMRKQPFFNKLHWYRAYREIQFHRMKEYEKAVQRLDVSKKKKFFQSYIKNPEGIPLLAHETEVFLAHYIFEEYRFLKPKNFDCILRKKVWNYLNGLTPEARIKLQTMIKEICEFVSKELTSFNSRLSEGEVI